MNTKKIFLNDESSAIELLSAFLNEFKLDALEWEIEVIRQEIDKRIEGEISEFNFDKLNAAMTVLVTDRYENDWFAFEVINHLLCNQPVDTESLDPLEAEELVAGLAEALLIKESTVSEDDKELVNFSDEVRAYAGLIFRDYGMTKAPDMFPRAIVLSVNTEGCEESDKEKNEALNEIARSKVELVLERLGKLAEDET